MFRCFRYGPVRVMCVVAVILVFNSTMAAAANPNKDQQKETQREKRELHEDRDRLDALQREETLLRREVERLEKRQPTLRDKLNKLEVEARELDTQLAAARKMAETAKDAAKAAKQALSDVTARIEESQPSNSDFAKARATYLAAKEEYAKSIDQIENSAMYRAAYQQAVDSPERTTLLPQVRKRWLDENPTVVAVRDRLLQSKATYEKLLSVLLHADPGWIKASGEAEEASSQEKDAGQELQTLVKKKASAEQSLAATRADLKSDESKLSYARNALKRIPEKKEALRREIERDRREVHDPRR
jgi:predicted RNase H-like nuclease (RuvC/YqgF family)